MYAYSNNGLSFRAWNDPSTLLAGEVYFDHAPSAGELTAAFPNYAAAVTEAAAAQQLAAVLGAGLAITSTGTPALNATYPLDAQTLADITAIAAGDAEGEGLPGGAATVPFPDVTGVSYNFTEAQFKAWATAIRNFVAQAKEAALAQAAGSQASWPPANAVIP